MEGIGKGAQGKGQSGLKGLRPLCVGLAPLGVAQAWLGCPTQPIVWRRPQAGSVLFPLSVSLSLFPLQQLRLPSASWGWAKGWRGGRGAWCLPKLFLRVGSQPLPCVLLAQGCGGSWLAAAWHHPTWLSLIAQCSGVSPGFPAKAEMSQTPLSCSRTCQDLQVTAGWAQVGWLPVPGLCCSRSWGGTSYVSVAQEGWLKRPRLPVGE